MKKKSIKKIGLNKKTISSLEDLSRVVGGQTMVGGICPSATMFTSCQVCPPEETEFSCPSWWGGQFCPSDKDLKG